METVLVIDIDKSCNSSDPPALAARGADLHFIRFYKTLYVEILVIPGFNMAFEGFVGHKGFDMLLLVGKDACLMLIGEIIIDHTPHGRIPRAGFRSYGFNGMLPIEYIIDPIADADLDRVDLIQVEILNHAQYRNFREIALVFLIGIQITDG